jgi:hypothetical protein
MWAFRDQLAEADAPFKTAEPPGIESSLRRYRKEDILGCDITVNDSLTMKKTYSAGDA